MHQTRLSDIATNQNPNSY